jgi:hypothetical protein
MKLEIGKIKRGWKKIIKKFSQNLFLFLIFLLLLDLALGGIFFWKYYLKMTKKETKIIPSLKINQVLMDQFSLAYQEREKLFELAKQKQYFDLFRGLVSE